MLPPLLLFSKTTNSFASALFVMHYVYFLGPNHEKTVQENKLTEVAGEGGTNWAPQKFLSSQKFRHLMG